MPQTTSRTILIEDITLLKKLENKPRSTIEKRKLSPKNPREDRVEVFSGGELWCLITGIICAPLGVSYT